MTDYDDQGSVVRVEVGGTLTVKDGSGDDRGTITGGKATNGGGITNHGTLELEEVIIKYNTTNENGGGVWSVGILKVKGGVLVWDNKQGDAPSNVFLQGEAVITVAGTIRSDFENIRLIGVTIEQDNRMVTNGFAVHNPGADPTHFFRTNKMGQNVALQDGEVVLTKNAPITYIERSWDEENNEVRSETKTRVRYTVLEGSHDNDWIGLGGNEWYAVKGKARYKVLNIIGNAHLVLSDGATLNCAHIKLEEGKTLSIYAQSNGNERGKLYAKNYSYKDAAAIVGGDNANMGSLYVHGGYIFAGMDTDDFIDADRASNSCRGAGIGGGRSGHIGGEAVIYAGRVYAKGIKGGAGIGGGRGGDQGGLVKIYGGDVKAISLVRGAGIGGGDGYGEGGNGGRVEIYGGFVEAEGGNSAARSKFSGAGIGGGSFGRGGDVHIHGGEIYAYSGSDAAGVGGSQEADGGTLEVTGGMLYASAFYDETFNDPSAPAIGGGRNGSGGNVTIKDGIVYAVKAGMGSETSAIIGGGFDKGNGTLTIDNGLKVSWGNHPDAILDSKYQEGEHLHLLEDVSQREATCQNRNYTYVQIEPCEEHGEYTYSILDGEKHRRVYRYCGLSEEEEHTFQGTNDCVCGQKYDGSNDNWTVNIITTADGTSYAAAEVNKVVRGNSYVLPVPGAVNGLTFMGYLKTTTAPSGIEMMDNEILELVDAGETITPEADVDYYARYRYNYKTMWTWADDGSKATVSISCDVNNDTQDGIEAYYCQETERTEATEEANGEVTYSASAEYKKAEGLTYQFTDQHKQPLFYTLNIDLNYTGDNTETLEKYQNRKANVTLRDRTFYKDNSWNTLCLPFDIDDFEGTPLADATVKTLSSSDYDSSAGKLALNFVDASAISAGKPCIVRWSSGEDVINPTFNEVIVSGTEGIVGTPFVDFKGTVSPVALTAGDRTVFYMGSNNKLYHDHQRQPGLFLIEWHQLQ